MDMELPVTLVVKAPNQKVGDQTIECGLGWTIKKLKQHISNVYPSKPTENQQKLIYSGRLLNDNLMLKDVLRQSESNYRTHTVHLVCGPSVAETSSLAPKHQESVGSIKNSDSASSAGSSSSSLEGSPSVTPPASPSPLTEGLRLRHTTNPAPDSTSSPEAVPLPTTTTGATVPPAGGPEAFQNMYGMNMMYGGGGAGIYPGMMPGMMAYSPEQMMWLQQMYAQQMAQYMQLYQGAMPPTPPGTPFQNQTFTPTGPAGPAAGGPAAPAAEGLAGNPPARGGGAAPVAAGGAAAAARGRGGGNGRAAGGDQPVRMNAQGGMVLDDDDDDMQRDWLDWMYTLSRVAVLLSIVYFYSTFGRFVMVLGLFVAAYLYQGGWFRVQRRERREQQQQEQQEPLQQQQQQQQEAQQEEHQLTPEPQQREEEDSEAAANGEEAAEEQEPAEVEAPTEPPPPGPLAVAWSFVYTFFSSLIPQQPVAVNAN